MHETCNRVNTKRVIDKKKMPGSGQIRLSGHLLARSAKVFLPMGVLAGITVGFLQTGHSSAFPDRRQTE